MMAHENAAEPQPGRQTFAEGRWLETVAVGVIGGAVMWLMTRPAFETYFFGENFIYLGMYRAHGNSFWQAFFSPSDSIFFRPVFFAASLPWYFLLPPDPFAYHIRNFVFSAVNLSLLHRVVTRLGVSARARWLACLFFAISKIHLTVVGYINIFDSAVLLMLLLLTVLFFLRYVQVRRSVDYLLGLLFCLLSVFSKDYGLVVVLVVAALVAAYGVNYGSWRKEAIWWSKRLSPLFVMAAGYLALRYTIVASLPSSNSDYAPQFSAYLALRKLIVFGSTLFNASFTDDDSTGISGLSTWIAEWIAGMSPHLQKQERLITALFCGCGLALLALTFWAGRRVGWKLLFPLVWIAVFLGPTLLVRNINIYYHYEPMAGVAVLLAILVNRAGSRISWLWLPALALIGLSGALSNYTPRYHWSRIAGKTQPIQKAVIEPFTGRQLKSITFLTLSTPFWHYALIGDAKGTMLQTLTRQPELRVKVTGWEHLPALRSSAREGDILIDVDSGFIVLQSGPDLPR
jgi:hypothetical protein